jgi:hypothetical protein
VVLAKWLKKRVQLRRMESSFETPGSEDMSLGAEELSRVFGIGSCRIMARKEFDCDKKTSCVI